MTYNAIDIAKYIINKCTLENCPISNLHLQKILYFLQRKYLREKGITLFIDEIQAWQFGPVVPEVYYQYCGFGSFAISLKYYDIDIFDEDAKIIDDVVVENRSKNPWELVKETHSKGGAWDFIYANGKGNHKVIPIASIKTRG